MDGTTKTYRRRILMKKVIREGEKEPLNEVDVKVEEVEIDEDSPEEEKYDPEVMLN